MQTPAIDPQIIAAMGALQGTLGGQTALQAQQAQDQQGVVDQANKAAQTAGQTYQQAAGQPAPDLGPMAALVPTLFGNTASVLSGNPDYAKRGHETVVQRKQDLADARLSNLQALRDQFDQKARAAEQLGNTELANEARMKQEQFSKAMQAILDQQTSDLAGKREKDLETQRQAGRMELERARAAAEAKKTGADQVNYLDSLVKTTQSGNNYLAIKDVPPKQKNQALQYAKDHGMIVADKNTQDRLDAADEVYRGFDETEDLIKRKLYAGTDLGGRAKQAAENLYGAKSQSDPELASFGNTAMLALRNLQALAAGMGSGLRITKAEYQNMVQNFPKITDNQPTALNKLKWERTFLANKEKSIFGKAWKPPATQADDFKSQALKADKPTFIQLLQAHPELDSDPEIVAQARKLKNG